VLDGNGRVVGDLVSVTGVSATGEQYLVQIGERVWAVRADGAIGDSGQIWFAASDTSCATPLFIASGPGQTRQAGVPYAPVVRRLNDGTVLAWDVPRDQTQMVVNASEEAIVTLRQLNADGTCTTAFGAMAPMYGTSALTRITPPTLVPPLTLG
jgi:hypothetical protein